MPLRNPLSWSTTMQMCWTLLSESAAVGRTEWGLMFTKRKLLWYIAWQYSWSHSTEVSWLGHFDHSLRPSIPTVAAANLFSTTLSYALPICISTTFYTCRLHLAVENSNPIIMTAKLWLYNDKRFTRWTFAHLCTYIRPCLHTGMYTLYSTQQTV